MQGALHNDVFTCLKVGLTAWTVCGGVGEESLAVFTNKDIACGHTGKMCTLSSCQFRVGIKPLLFISVRQRELVRVLASLVYLLIHNLLGLCT